MMSKRLLALGACLFVSLGLNVARAEAQPAYSLHEDGSNAFRLVIHRPMTLEQAVAIVHGYDSRSTITADDIERVNRTLNEGVTELAARNLRYACDAHVDAEGHFHRRRDSRDPGVCYDDYVSRNLPHHMRPVEGISIRIPVSTAAPVASRVDVGSLARHQAAAVVGVVTAPVQPATMAPQQAAPVAAPLPTPLAAPPVTPQTARPAPQRAQHKGRPWFMLAFLPILFLLALLALAYGLHARRKRTPRASREDTPNPDTGPVPGPDTPLYSRAQVEQLTATLRDELHRAQDENDQLIQRVKVLDQQVAAHAGQLSAKDAETERRLEYRNRIHTQELAEAQEATIARVAVLEASEQALELLRTTAKHHGLDEFTSTRLSELLATEADLRKLMSLPPEQSVFEGIKKALLEYTAKLQGKESEVVRLRKALSTSDARYRATSAQLERAGSLFQRFVAMRPDLVQNRVDVDQLSDWCRDVEKLTSALDAGMSRPVSDSWESPAPVGFPSFAETATARPAEVDDGLLPTVRRPTIIPMEAISPERRARPTPVPASGQRGSPRQTVTYPPEVHRDMVAKGAISDRPPTSAADDFADVPTEQFASVAPGQVFAQTASLGAADDFPRRDTNKGMGGTPPPIPEEALRGIDGRPARQRMNTSLPAPAPRVQAVSGIQPASQPEAPASEADDG